MSVQCNMQKVALVTGVTSQIGRAIAKKLAANGYKVALHFFRNEQAVNELHLTLKAQDFDTVVVQADLTKIEQVNDLFHNVNNTLGPVSALVNVAGIDGGRSTIDKLQKTTLENVMETNFYGAVYCIQQAQRQMMTIGKGSIVNITSQAAVFGGHHLAHYAASKAALVAFTTGVARELITNNIRINNVSPGPVELESSSVPFDASTLPIKRLAKTNEVANTVAWLLSDEASYVSGVTIPVTAAR